MVHSHVVDLLQKVVRLKIRSIYLNRVVSPAPHAFLQDFATNLLRVNIIHYMKSSHLWQLTHFRPRSHIKIYIYTFLSYLIRYVVASGNHYILQYLM